MKQETMSFLKVLFTLPEVEKIQIKELIIPSYEDELIINAALDLCYHDRYSDVDINAHIRLHPIDFYGTTPVYKEHFSRLGFQDELLGKAFVSMENGKEGIRICKASGIRIDFTCFPTLDEGAMPFESACEDEKTTDNSEKVTVTQSYWDLEKADWFWFVAVQALGKLMRKDYLIATHLANILINEGLHAQMIIRDHTYNTNIHRYGYAEELEFLSVIKNSKLPFTGTEDETYNHIAEFLHSAVVSYDKLIPMLNGAYRSKLPTYMKIWDCYIMPSTSMD